MHEDVKWLPEALKKNIFFLKATFLSYLYLLTREAELITEELISRCLKKNQSAQRELYSKISPALMKICERYCKTAPLAQDAFQEAIITIFNHLNQWSSDKGQFEGWCYRITVNNCLTLLRKENRFCFEDIDDKLVEQNIYLEENDDMTYKDIKNIINELPEGQRLIFNMYAIEGYRHKEIATELNISVGTSKSQLAKARAKLKESYIEHFIAIG